MTNPQSQAPQYNTRKGAAPVPEPFTMKLPEIRKPLVMKEGGLRLPWQQDYNNDPLGQPPGYTYYGRAIVPTPTPTKPRIRWFPWRR